MAEILLSDITQTTLDGTGVFDSLMRATKAHLDDQFLSNRIKGPEYAQVYLGSLDSVLKASLDFILQKQKIALDAELMTQQIILAQVEVTKANAAVRLMDQQVLVAQIEVTKSNAQVDLLKQQVINSAAELAILTANQGKIAAEVTHLGAQTALTAQQKSNLTVEAANIPKQGALLDAQVSKAAVESLHVQQQTLLTTQQITNLAAEALNITKQGAVLDTQKTKLVAEVAHVEQQTQLTQQQRANLSAEALNIPKQGLILDNQKIKLVSETAHVDKQTLLTTQQTTNLTAEFLNIEKNGRKTEAEICLLKAQYDLTMTNNIKAASENNLLMQKTATEKAQTTQGIASDGSVIGKQIQLYAAQTDGFRRDAEQKAAKILVDGWSVQKTINADTPADSFLGSNFSNMTSVINKLKSGIGAA